MFRSSLTASEGMDFEKPSPLQVSVGVRTSVTTGFLCIAGIAQSDLKLHELNVNHPPPPEFIEMRVMTVNTNNDIESEKGC